MAVKYCTGKRSSAVTGRRSHSSAQPSQQPALYQQQAPAVQAILQPPAALHTSGTQGQGSLRANSTLAPNQFSAPADPTAVVTTADGRASAFLSSASIFSLLDGFSLSQSLAGPTSTSMQAYLDRFGPPEQRGQQFRNRFSGASFATRNEAQSAELDSLSTRFSNLGDYLDAGIRYRSNDRTRINIGSCKDRCSAHPGWGAWTCDNRAAHAIALCPLFWSASDDERATIIIHELAHMRYQLGNHNFGSVRQRGRNPECYASYAADLFGISSFSGQCPVI